MVEVMDGEDRVFFTEAVVRGARVCNPHLPIAQRIKAMHDARQEAGGGATPHSTETCPTSLLSLQDQKTRCVGLWDHLRVLALRADGRADKSPALHVHCGVGAFRRG